MITTLSSSPITTLSKAEKIELGKKTAKQVEQLLILKQNGHIDGWTIKKGKDVTHTTIIHAELTRSLQSKISEWQKSMSCILNGKTSILIAQGTSHEEDKDCQNESTMADAENMSDEKKLQLTQDELNLLKNGDISDVLGYLSQLHKSFEAIQEKPTTENQDNHSLNTTLSKIKNSELFNQSSSLQDKAYIDRLYWELEGFDPECRSGRLQTLSSDSSKVKQEKELRALLYNRACQEFGKKSEKRINYIQSYYSENPKKALYQYPENIIPECDSPMLSLDEYKRLCGQIYSINQPKIDKFVEELYGERRVFPGTITLDGIKTGFRLVFGNQVEPRPYIIIGWDLKDSYMLYLDIDLHIT